MEVKNMKSMIYNPLQEYEEKFKNVHLENTKSYFSDMLSRSGVDVEENRRTVKLYESERDSVKKIRRKYKLLRILRVIMCITVVLIPLVLFWFNRKIKDLGKKLNEQEAKIAELMALCQKQMAPLNALFSDNDAVNIIEKTIPDLSFSSVMSVEDERNMIENFDFSDHNNSEQSTLDILSGNYNGNPFIFENKLIHKMGSEVYHGYKIISWTETYRDRDGKIRTRTRTQTLHASLVKPKPFYSTEVSLTYCSQGGPELSFTRDATALHKKSEKQIDKYVKKGEKKLKKKTNRAVKENKDFVSMSNTDFEVLFDALDRDNEVQFRTLFTPLAQKNMVDLILSKSSFGDDFDFVKRKRTNYLISEHSRNRKINLNASDYISYSYDIIESNFLNKNTRFFKDVYFDFAPLWAIPIYQENPVHSLKPIPDIPQSYSFKECEAVINLMNPTVAAHPATKTQAILKSDFIRARSGVDEVRVTAFSYDVAKRLDFVPTMGGDGRIHAVPVPWDEYVPLVASNTFFVTDVEKAENKSVMARRGGVCVYK